MTRGKCGTYAGYVAHTYHSEVPCEACKAASRDYMRAYRRRGADRWVNERLGTCVRGLGWPR